MLDRSILIRSAAVGSFRMEGMVRLGVQLSFAGHRLLSFIRLHYCFSQKKRKINLHLIIMRLIFV